MLRRGGVCRQDECEIPVVADVGKRCSAGRIDVPAGQPGRAQRHAEDLREQLGYRDRPAIGLVQPGKL